MSSARFASTYDAAHASRQAAPLPVHTLSLGCHILSPSPWATPKWGPRRGGGSSAACHCTDRPIASVDVGGEGGPAWMPLAPRPASGDGLVLPDARGLPSKWLWPQHRRPPIPRGPAHQRGPGGVPPGCSPLSGALPRSPTTYLVWSLGHLRPPFAPPSRLHCAAQPAPAGAFQCAHPHAKQVLFLVQVVRRESHGNGPKLS